MNRNSKWIVIIAIVTAVFFMMMWDFTPRASMKGKGAAKDEKAGVSRVSTEGYRSPSGRHKVSISDASLAKTVQSQGARLIADYGSYKLLEVNDSIASSLSSNAAAQINDENNLILLNAGVIDTSSASAQSLRTQSSGSSGKRMRLIQFAGPIQPEWYNALAKTGVRIVTYIPNNAYLVYGSGKSLQAMQTLAAASSVQWDGDYLAAYRVDPAITSTIVNKEDAATKSKSTKAKTPVLPNLSTKGNEQFAIQLVADDVENATTLALINKLKLEPILKQDSMLGYMNVKVALPKSAVIDYLANRPDVVSIQQWITPKKLDERQDIIITGNVSGSPAVPPPTDYLAYLAGKGFTFNTPTSFAVNISDSGVDNATTTPNHFGLYLLGDASLPANSRIIYNRLLGTPNGGSTLQGCDGHGNLNTHIICGYVPTGTVAGVNFAAFPHADASGFRWGLGVLPNARVGSSVIFDPDTFTGPTYQNLESQAYNNGARISSNSWGSSSNAYTIDSQQYDALVRDAQPDTGCTGPNCISTPGNQEYVIVFAAGNNGSGPNTVGSPSTGKNLITVGAAENVSAFGGADGCGVGDTGADNANDIIGFSGRGPTADGRKKPDIVGPGTHVSGGVAQASIASPNGSGTGAQNACFVASGVCGGTSGNNFFPAGQQYYTVSSGTSHSTPATSGAAALIRQHFINMALTPPTPAMTKALLLNSTRYMNGVGANDSLPSNNQGYGEISFNNYFDLFTTPSIRRDQVPADKFTASGQQRIITGTISDNTKPFRVTLAWTDTPGPTSGNAFVNNLDLEVTVGGNTYKGNVFVGASSATGGTADTRDNVESVFIPAGITGNFVVKVIGTNIAGNGVPGDADALDQDYAIVVSNSTTANIPVIATGTAAITAESCVPANSAADVGETVTLDLPVTNIGTANTTNLVATLQATGGVTSPSGPQNYGVVVAGGPAVTRSFTFTVDPSIACGAPLTVTLQMQDGAANLGTVTYVLRVGILGGAQPAVSYSTGNIAVPIPDVSSVDIPIVVAPSGAVADVNVKVRLNHTFDGDLVMDLIAPDGTTVNLVTSRGGAGANYGSGSNDCAGTYTVFDDAAATAIGAGGAPFASSFRPESALSAFNGHTLTGTWKLRVTDTAALDTGTVGCVTLDISKQAFVCCGVAGTPLITAAGSAVITAESIAPANNAPDPGETLTVNLPVINVGDGNTTNLVGTLQTSGGVTPSSGPQNYGVVVAGGSSVTRPFTFVASGTCGNNITLSLQLQDGASNLGTVTYTLTLGTISSSSQTFSNSASITIPASGTGDTAGAPATPYPSNITVAGAPTTIDKVTVTLTNFNHTFPDDVDFLLVSPTGRKMIILSDAGSSTVATNLNFVLDDAAAGPPPDGTGITSGTFKPANYGTVQDPFPAPAPAGPYLTPAPGGTDTLTSAFTGVAGGNPNGTWSLYIVDDASVDSGTLAGGWSLTLTSLTNVCNTQTCSLVCPANITVPADGGGVSAVVNYPGAGVTGACGVLNYSTPSGSTFPVGTTVVTVTGANAATCQFNVTVTGTGTGAGDLVISEFRTNGPGGVNDEFVEIYNTTGAPITVADVGAGAGYGVVASDGTLRCTIPNGTVIPSHGHFLCANSTSYSLGGYAAADGTYTTDIPNDAGIALFRTTAVAGFTLANRLDAVGSSTEANTLYKEGTGYPASGALTNLQYSFYRNLNPTGLPADTNNNATDFVYVETNGTFSAAGQRLGAPGPENLASPLQRNATIKPSLIDPPAGTGNPPNRVRDFTSDPPNNSTFGTLDIRRKFTNQTGAPVTRLRFRVVDMTTFPSPPGTADLRPRTSTLIVVATTGGPVNVEGTTLEQPPSQPNGGGLNSTMSAGTITLGTPLGVGASINVRFLLGVQQVGAFRFFINVEALP